MDEDLSCRSFARGHSGQREDMASYELAQSEGSARFYASGPRYAIPIRCQKEATRKLCLHVQISLTDLFDIQSEYEILIHQSTSIK